MKKLIQKSIAIVMCIAVMVSLAVIPSSAGAIDDVQNQIDKLEQQIKDKANEIKDIQNDKSKQQQLKAAYEEQMALIQAQIDLCNSVIRETNSKIAQNEADIIEKEAEMADVINEFKKRMNAIYMSGNTNSGIEILLGADDFSDFLALSQLTLNISKRDQKMIDDITEMIKEINQRKDENTKLLEEQKAIMSTLDAKYDEFDALADEAQRLINNLSGQEQNAANDKKRLEADLKAKEAQLEELLNPSDVYQEIFDGRFVWPVPGYLGITSPFGERWGTTHKGIDIASANIKGKPVVASASGKVVGIYTACTHNYGKNSSCYNSSGKRCGGGYGNYVTISHGQSGSKYYQSMYAHMSSVVVKSGQYVKQGDVIGYVGTTGYSTGNHLHFEIHTSSNGKTFTPVDPEPYVKKTK